MKRDLDLIRAVLLAAEAHDSPLATHLTIPGYSQDQIEYHCRLLADDGHELLDASRELVGHTAATSFSLAIASVISRR